MPISTQEVDPITDIRKGVENKISEFKTLLRDLDRVIDNQDDRGKRRIGSSFGPLIGELHNLAERLTDRVVDCRG